MTAKPNPRNDLIDDRELQIGETDRLDHQQFADQLAEIALSVQPPSNIALYGPWGSGKSGIANLLKSRVEQAGKTQRREIKFVRFDAFKYADNPLRRNFISAMAQELQVNDRKFREDLYADKVDNEIALSKQDTAKIVGWFFGILFGLIVLISVVLLAVAAFKDGKFSDVFKEIAIRAIPASVVPSTIISALIGVLTVNFQVKRSQGKPESDEQFEKLLADLVTQSKADRLIIFVDELDRCAPKHVVETLDAVRTFFGVRRCVFIVAADQAVLEEALSEEARQSTPLNSQNPYYSAGSAYLDKVFQYQISLPPLFPQSITKFAVSLVADRTNGVWAEVDLPRVASVLIPSHVASPRRVKHLMNAFALTYRAAQSRYESGELSEDPSRFAESIAKLTCLRVEFPTFARDLEQDVDLVSKVLDSHVAAEDGTLASAYAHGTKETAKIIADHENSEVAAREEVVKQQGRDLLNYLQRTKSILGPSKHLMYLRTVGRAVGLPGNTGDAIESAAANDNLDEAVGLVEGLTFEQRGAALEYLLQQSQHEVGIERENYVRTMLRLIGRDLLDVRGDSNRIADLIASLDTRDSNGQSRLVSHETYEGVWRIAALASTGGSGILRKDVLALLVRTETLSAECVLADAEVADLTDRDDFAMIIENRFTSIDGDHFVERLVQLEATPLARIVLTSSENIGNALEEAAQAWLAQEEVEDEESEQSDEVVLELVDPQSIRDRIGRLIEHLAPINSVGAYRLVTALLAENTPSARDAVERLLPTLPPTKSPFASQALMLHCADRALRKWPIWLDSIDPAHLKPNFHKAALGRLASVAWSSFTNAQTPATEEDFVTAASAIGSMAEGLLPEHRPRWDTKVSTILAIAPVNDELVDQQTRLLLAVPALLETGLLDANLVVEALLSGLSEALANSDVESVSEPKKIASHVATLVETVLLVPGPWIVSDAHREDVYVALHTSPWIEDPLRTELLLSVTKAAKQHDQQMINGAVVFPSDIAILIDKYGAEADSVTALWIENDDHTPQDVFTALRKMMQSGRIPASTQDAIESQRAKWTKLQREEFAVPWIGTAGSDLPQEPTVVALGLRDIDESRLANELVTRYEQSTNNEQRKQVLDLWSMLRIGEPASTTLLVSKVATPMVLLDRDGGNEKAVLLVLDVLSRLDRALPQAARKQFGPAVEISAGHHKKVHARAKSTLPRLGFGKRSLGFLKGDTIEYDS